MNDSTETLSAAAPAMNEILGQIRTVASQINLLALSAKIEGTQVGDAGEMFAVVELKPKNLAVQAADAADQIASELRGTQTTSWDLSDAPVEIYNPMVVMLTGLDISIILTNNHLCLTCFSDVERPEVEHLPVLGNVAIANNLL